MELMTPEGGTLFWTVVTFLSLLVILRKVAWKPILQTLDEREKIIQESLDKAEKANIEAEKTLAGQSDLLDSAKKEGQELVAKSRLAAEGLKEDILKKANSEAEQLLKKAKREIELSRDKAIEEIRDLSIELSMAATTKMIGKSLDEKEHKELIQDSLKKLGNLN